MQKGYFWPCTKKSETTNVEAIVAALESMMSDEGISLESAAEFASAQMLLNQTNADEEDDRYRGYVSRARLLVEKIDHSLQAATMPLDGSCQQISLLTKKSEVLVEFGPAERAVIINPLTLPPPTAKWTKNLIRFERINRKTGRALFYFEYEQSIAEAAHYSKIIDPDVRKPGNVYTQAFSDDLPIDVWVRQVGAEKGRLNFQWEISVKGPDQLELFP